MPSKSVQQEIERASIEVNVKELEHLLKLHLESYDREKSELFEHCLLTHTLAFAYGQLFKAVNQQRNQ